MPHVLIRLLCIWVHVHLIVCMQQPEQSLTVGVIADGNSSVETTCYNKYVYNVSIIWHYVEIAEVFQIYKSLQLLDSQDDVDVIVLFDYDPVVFTMSKIIQTTNTPLIKWGEKRHPHQKDTQIVHKHDVCGDEEVPTPMIDDPYCMTDLNVSASQTYGQTAADSLTVLAPHAVKELVEVLKWESVFVLHENATEREADQLVAVLSSSRILVVLLNIDVIHDLNETIMAAYKPNIRINPQINFIVLCQFRCARNVLRKANKFDSSQPGKTTLLKHHSRWLVIIYGYSGGAIHALKACANDLDNVVVMAIPEFSGAGSEGLVEVLNTILYTRYRGDGRDTNVTDTLGEFVQSQLAATAANSNPTLRCKAFKIETLMWTPEGRGFSTVGYMETTSGRVVVHSELFPNIRFGYNKRQFVISTLQYPPFTDKTNGSSNITYVGFCFDIFTELSRMLNFTYRVTEPTDKMWGAMIQNGNSTFNGLMGQLERKEIDIVVAPIAVSAERARVVDFAYPFFYEFTTVLLKKPHPNTLKWRTLINPFKWEVLVSIGLALALVTVMAFLLERYNPFYEVLGHAEERSINGGLHNFHNAFWYIYGALLCQGGVHLPESIAGRTFVSAWWIFCMIVVGTYCGNLIAFLTVTREKAPFNSLEEMVKMKETYKWGTIGQSVFQDTFLKSVIPDYKAVGDGLREFNATDPGVLNADPEYHVTRVKQGGYAWIGDKTYIQVAMQEECDLMTIREEFYPLTYAFAFTKNSPHTLIFSEKMLLIHESGLMRIWRREWWPAINFCAVETVGSKPISLVDVQSAFFVLGIGIFFGVVALVVEVLLYRYRQRKQGQGGDPSAMVVKYTTDGTPPDGQS